jgi:hypothetical protein
MCGVSVKDIYYEDEDSDSQSDDDEWEVKKIFQISKTEESYWWEKVSINGQEINCQIDTASPKCLISEKLASHLTKEKPKPTTKRFISYTKHPIEVVGSLRLQVEGKRTKGLATFYVVKDEQAPLLSGQVAEKLQLIARIKKIQRNESAESMLNQLEPEIGKTTGLIPKKYRLKVDPTAKPQVNGPRRYPAHLMPRIKEKLREMEKEGQIIKVTEPTEWVNSMHPVVAGEKFWNGSVLTHRLSIKLSSAKIILYRR